MEKGRVLVTGGSGFLGSHIADSLSREGYKVRILDLKKSPWLSDTQEMVEGNILDKSTVLEAVEGCDFVYHLGAIADIDDALRDSYSTMEVNVLGTINILEASKKFRVERLLFASSIYVHSRNGGFYRISKHACELLLEEYKELFNLDYTILRFGTLYGLRSDAHNSVYRYLKSALTKRKMVFNGNGQEAREYIHVLDAADICVRAMEKKYSGQNLILTGNHSMKVTELLSMIREILGNDIEIIHNLRENQSHYTKTPYSYHPRVGKKIVSNEYCDLGQSLVEILEEIDQNSKNSSD